MEQPSAQELQATIAAYREATEYAWDEIQRMRRGRIFIAWMAVALAAAAAASLYLPQTGAQIVIGVVQLLLWVGIAALNFSGPRHQKPLE